MIVALLLAAAAFAVLSLVSGASYLGVVLPGGLPLGNLLAAVPLCAIAGAAVRLSPASTAARYASLVSLAASVAWLPVSIALAGNLALNFSGSRGSAWLAFSIAVAVVAVCVLGWAFVAALLAKQKRVGAA